MALDLIPASDADPARARHDPSLLRVRRGIYVDRAAAEALTHEARHVLRVRAVAAARPDAIFARESALALAGAPHGRPSDVFTIGDPNMPGVLAGVRNSHVAVADADIVREDGIARCTPAYALAHLARVGRQVDAVSALDWALRLEVVTKDEVTDALGRQGPRGRRRAAWAIGFADPLAGSVGESWSRVAIHRVGAPPPQLQVRVLTRLGARFPDFLWERPGRRPLGGEFDGAWKYGVIADANGVQPVDAVIEEKRRDDALREHIDTLHWMWDAAQRPLMLGRLLAAHDVPVRSALLPGW
ncbi:hypothetical protein [Agrococcus carbonis]|uniref:Transcriptional regulator, AbiEi antitoxin, Type IV TA system n=1 Tax=Agrococcus carbonis TaxID=684552 RepID=A0A1H1QWJ9_9MICO|nr:hypothetical protein [Agrococcus carbonis]SDS27715.1 hypothetical protein SAMN04489719_1948 [Agrococcus carbonis]